MRRTQRLKRCSPSLENKQLAWDGYSTWKEGSALISKDFSCSPLNQLAWTDQTID